MTHPTQTRLIQAAVDLFNRNGLSAVGIDQIIHEVGITKTTFYTHFESKDALVLAVVQDPGQWWYHALPEHLRERAGSNPLDQLRTWIDLVTQSAANTANTGGLLLQAIAAYPLPHEPAHRAIREAVTELQQGLSDIADAAGLHDPDALAQQLILLMEAVLFSQAIDPEADGLQQAARIANQLIDQAQIS